MSERPIPLAARSKAWFYRRSHAGIEGWNPVGAWMSVCCDFDNLCWGILPNVACPRRGIHETIVHATHLRVQSPASERAESKLTMPITRRNEKSGQSASSALIHHSASQRWTEEFYCVITRYLLAISMIENEYRSEWSWTGFQLHSYGFRCQRVESLS